MSKKTLALLLCALLLLGTVGCLEKEEKAESDPRPVAGEAAAEPGEAMTTDGPADTLDVDGVIDTPSADTSETDSLPAFTLGDITVTVGEVRSSYYSLVQYLGYYGVAVPTTDKEIKQYRDMIIEDLLTAKVLPWKAKQMGLELTEEKKIEVAQEVEKAIAEYAADFLEDAKAALGEDAGAAELALKARELLEKDVEDYLGYPFDQWLQEVTTSYEESALTELLQEKVNEGIVITEEEAKAWFDTELKGQEESFATDSAAYKDLVTEYALGDTDVPPLYTPEGFARMQVITFEVDANDSATYSANELEMINLEAEYGKLLLQGKDEDRQAEIVTRYQELQVKNEELLQKNSDKAQKARVDALNGMDFTEIFNLYSNQEGSMGYFGYAEGEPRRNGIVVFSTNVQDSEWPEQVWKAAKDMQEGEISELLLVGDTFYLIKRLNDLPAGPAAFADDPEVFTAAALTAKQAEEWNAIQEDWLNEARNAAVFYEDNYADVGLQ